MSAALTTQQLTELLHTAADLESAIYTLNRTIPETKEQIKARTPKKPTVRKAPPAKEPKPEKLNWQKAYENGEHLRSAEITEEQNYNMIDGRMNNLPLKPWKIGNRISVLDRLHLKQAEIARRSGKAVPQMAEEEEMERRRK